MDILQRFRLPPTTGRAFLLLTAIGQALGPTLVTFASAPDDPPVVPAGYAFAVWGVIILGCLASAVYGLPKRRATSTLFRSLHIPLSVVHVLFVLWLLAAGSSRTWLTVPIFAAMLVLTLSLLFTLSDEAAPAGSGQARGDTSGQARGDTSGQARGDIDGDRVGRILVLVTLGIYAGWSTAALWVNAVTQLPDFGVSLAGGSGLAWQIGFLLAACLMALLVTRQLTKLRATVGTRAYVGTVAWALIAIAVSAAAADEPVLLAVALAASGALVATALRGTAAASQRHTPGEGPNQD